MHFAATEENAFTAAQAKKTQVGEILTGFYALLHFMFQLLHVT